MDLPHGWIKEFNNNTNHPFYVDTNAKPPRSIWVHPYEDEQYLSENPKARNNGPYRRHSFNGTSTAKPELDQHPKKRGFFGKIKDKAIGTKEERQAEKQNLAILQERRRQQRLSAQSAYGMQQSSGGYDRSGFGPPIGNPYGGIAGRRGGMGMGGMGMGLPLMGGLAGGLLLGDMMGGDGGGFGGDGGGGGGGFGGDGGGGGGFGGDGGGFGGDGGGIGF